MVRMNYLKALPAALLALGFAAGVQAQQPSSTAQQGATGAPSATQDARDIPAATGRSAPHPKSSLSHSDRSFVEKAAKGGMAEVDLGKLAQQRASSPEVKQFAQRMVDDHSKANEKLMQLAQEKGVTLPQGPKHAENHEVSKLSKLQGADFDKAYMDHMVKDHEKDVKEFKKEAQNAKDPDVKSFAQETAPTLEEHLQLAQSTDQAVGGKHAKSAKSPKENTRTSMR